MNRRTPAIVFIFACTAVAWMILAGTITNRTYSSDDASRKKVTSSWGKAQVQVPPTATYEREDPIEGEPKKTRTVIVPVPIEANRVDVNLGLDQRQKGLLWYSTYTVAFDGSYTFRNSSQAERQITFDLPLPSQEALYDNVQVA